MPSAAQCRADQRRADGVGREGGGLVVLGGIDRGPGGAVHHRVGPGGGEGGGDGVGLVEFEFRLAEQERLEALRRQGVGQAGGELPAAAGDQDAAHHHDPCGKGGRDVGQARRGAVLVGQDGRAAPARRWPSAGSSQAMPPSAARS